MKLSPIGGGDSPCDVKSVTSECLNLCRTRATMKLSNKGLRENLDRDVRCDFVEATWKALASTLKVDNTVVNDAPVAWCSMKDLAPAMLDACTTKFKKVDPYQRNEIWLGVGIDGVPLWHSHVISVSTCLLADIDGLPIHGPHSSSPTKKSSQAKGRTCYATIWARDTCGSCHTRR